MGISQEVLVPPESAEPRQHVSNLQDMGLDSRQPAYCLDVVFGDKLPDQFQPPDELIQELLTTGGSSVLYGDSNTGKTFAVIDMCCSIARGVPWMGRQTEQGLVVYLAAESPASVRGRVQAYQLHHGVKIPNLAIVQNPINLFEGTDDTDKVIEVVRQIEAAHRQKVRLIVGDTLARLSAGANENAGQDMGKVIERLDRIRVETGAHFMLVHHCGKNAAAGARGWSGVRGAVDTEIEVTEQKTGRCLEFTKQRDLPTKGVRIGFSLEVLKLGTTKWGAPATSCVVAPIAAPKKQKSKRVSEIGFEIVELLRTNVSPVKKSLVVKHFDGRNDSSSVYRELKNLVESGQILEASEGAVALPVSSADSAK